MDAPRRTERTPLEKGLLGALLVLFAALAVQYTFKATQGDGHRSAILRWRQQLLSLADGEDVYEGNPYPNPPPFSPKTPHFPTGNARFARKFRRPGFAPWDGWNPPPATAAGSATSAKPANSSARNWPTIPASNSSSPSKPTFGLPTSCLSPKPPPTLAAAPR